MPKNGARIVGLGGSLAPSSVSLSALNIALEGAHEAGAETRLFDISSLDLPMYAPERKETPQSALTLSDAVYKADGLLWSSPMYHGTISGSFKNALDWLQLLADKKPPYLTNKVVGLISTAGGVQGLQAINTMEFVVRSLRGWAAPLVMPIPKAWQVFDDKGQVSDARVEQQLKDLGAEVARASLQFKAEGFCDYSQEPVTTH
ncbi:MAG: NAD(P)H-dependent oxidoreductase [Chloroflexi bacterium]|nr:NAD(P)H-dependent oxidoreductase [Chloroflexota bacterium]